MVGRLLQRFPRGATILAKRRLHHRAAMNRCITAGPTFFLDPFARRQWDDRDYKGTHIDYDPVRFVERLHEVYATGECPLSDGYAPFCKHLFVENFVGALSGAMEITDHNAALLRSGYIQRRPEELAVLSRWFPKEAVEVPVAAYLDVILYSREQIVKESQTLQGGAEYSIPDVPWGIVSIKAQMEDHETPMTPITIMRNALGTEYGGSGVAIDGEAYRAAVKYWDTHAVVL